MGILDDKYFWVRRVIERKYDDYRHQECLRKIALKRELYKRIIYKEIGFIG